MTAYFSRRRIFREPETTWWPGLADEHGELLWRFLEHYAPLPIGEHPWHCEVPVGLKFLAERYDRDEVLECAKFYAKEIDAVRIGHRGRTYRLPSGGRRRIPKKEVYVKA